MWLTTDLTCPRLCPIDGLHVVLPVLTCIELDAVDNVLLNSRSNAAPLELPNLTIVICPSLGATANDAGLRLIPLLLHARFVRLSANAMLRAVLGCPDENSELKKFTVITAWVR